MTAMALASAVLMGVLGGAHCAVMCGGVVAMSCSALSVSRRGRPSAQLPYLLAYNAGRIASYAMAGAAAGALGSTMTALGATHRAPLALRLVAGVLMVAVGLYIAGFVRALKWIEHLGAPAWRRIAPLGRRLVPIRSAFAAVALGALWGWLPCGLVYSALVAAAASGSAAAGAATMAAFGIGTLPALVAMGSAVAVVARAARHATVRAAAGALMVGFGLVQLTHVGGAWSSTSHGAAHCCPSRGSESLDHAAWMPESTAGAHRTLRESLSARR
ncbi:MAG TPA: sulfite exporter TauE/SafE family protein [Polyangiaceae bacterium]|nr:sulfite exporter TauE/SafE family protein [Polyangiaceae bacterium]